MKLPQSHIKQAIYLAEEIEAGKSVQLLRKQHGLKLRLTRRIPHRMHRRRGWRKCRSSIVDSRNLVICHRYLGSIAVSLNQDKIRQLDFSGRQPQWLVVRGPLDPEAPLRGMLSVLLLVGVVIMSLSALIASFTTKPLRTSIEAMNRMAKGELNHRLPESGSPELQALGQSFNRMADRISTLLAAERSLIAGISHELRTPLTRLRLQLELLKDKAVPIERLTAMEKNVEDIDNLIGEIIESSRLSMSERKIDLVPVDLIHVVEEALSQQPLVDHQVRIEGHSGPVLGDHQRLVRVIRNLLDNTSKYAPIDTEVYILVEEATVTVSDRGPGVPESEVDKLFEPFFRGQNTSKSKSKGYGLGLMIARQIAQLHGGSLRAQNRSGGGLSVKLEIPRYETKVN